MAECLVTLESTREARQCIEAGKRILVKYDIAVFQTAIDRLERAIA